MGLDMALFRSILTQKRVMLENEVHIQTARYNLGLKPLYYVCTLGIYL